MEYLADVSKKNFKIVDILSVLHDSHRVVTSAVGRESRDGKFPGIPGFLAFPGIYDRDPGKNSTIKMKLFAKSKQWLNIRLKSGQ